MGEGRQAIFSSWALWLAVMLVVVSGCEDKRRHQTSKGLTFVSGEAVVGAAAPPADVARAFLGALREAQTVRQRGLGTPENREAYERAMGKIGHLAARGVIREKMSKVGSRTLPLNLSEEAATTLVSESWVSIAAYYVDGFLFHTMRVAPKGPKPHDGVLVSLEAQRPRDRQRLEEVEASAAVAGAKDAAGKPLRRGTAAYNALVQSKTLALEQGFNIPIRARFTVELWQVDGAWRVVGLEIGPAPVPGPMVLPARSGRARPLPEAASLRIPPAPDPDP